MHVRVFVVGLLTPYPFSSKPFDLQDCSLKISAEGIIDTCFIGEEVSAFLACGLFADLLPPHQHPAGGSPGADRGCLHRTSFDPTRNRRPGGGVVSKEQPVIWAYDGSEGAMRTISVRLDDCSEARLERLCQTLDLSQNEVVKAGLDLLQQHSTGPAALAEGLGLIGSFSSAAQESGTSSRGRDYSALLRQKLSRQQSQQRLSRPQP